MAKTRDMGCDIDWSTLVGDPAAVAPRMIEALGEYGHLRLHAHPLAPLRAPLLDQAQRLFALPTVTKRRLHIAHSTNFRGYSGLDEEQTEGIPDHKETFDLGLEQPRWDGTGPGYRRLLGPNLWPSPVQLPGFEQACARALAAAREVGVVLLRSLGLGLGLEPELDLDALLGPAPFSLMRLLRYPAVAARPGDRGPRGIGPHTDYGLFAFVIQDAIGGLAVEDPAGRWRRVEPEPEPLLVLIGDALETLSGGALRATPHAVASPRCSADRYSVALFFEPSLDAEIRPLRGAPAGVGAESLAYGAGLDRALSRSFPALS